MEVPIEEKPLGSMEAPYIQPVMTGYATRAATPVPSFEMSISENDNHYARFAAWRPFSNYGVATDGAFGCQRDAGSNMDITFESPVKISSIDCHIMAGYGFTAKQTISVLIG